MAPEILILAAAAGGLAASAITPAACHWPSRTTSVLKQRLFMLEKNLPQRLRRRAGAGALAAVLTVGGLAAYAAQPPLSAPERLPGEAVGVVGSGDRLSLVVSEDGRRRTISEGQEYADGWMLRALTPIQATLGKAGEVRRVGLNPSGVVATSAEAGPSPIVAVIDPAVSAIIGAENASAACRADYFAKGGSPRGPFRSEDEGRAWEAASKALLGEETWNLCFNQGLARLQAIHALNDDQRRAYYTQIGDMNAVRAVSRLPPIGPAVITGPSEIGLNAIAVQSAGLKSAAGYSTGIPPEPQNVLYKCWTPETPATVARKCEMQAW